MKRGTGFVLVGAVCLLAGASAVSAQGPYVFFGGGANLPMGDFKDGAKTGWIAQGGIGVDIAKVKGLWVEAEGWYGSNSGKETLPKTTLWAALGGVGYNFTPDKKVSPYIVGAAGILSGKAEGGESDSQFGYSGGAGLGYNASDRFHIWVEGRFLGNKNVTMIPITAGVTITFGGGGM